MLKIEPVQIDNKSLLCEIIGNLRLKDSKSDVCKACLRGKEYCRTCPHGNRYRISAHMPYILNRYNFYLENQSSLEMITPDKRFDKRDAEILRSQFHHGAAFQRERGKMIDELWSEIKGKCPFCMISEPTTLDHYFPESKYPEFILFTYNLVPCCGQCNGLKGASLFGDNGERLFFHYYFDELPSKRLLVADINLNSSDNHVPIIEFYIDADEKDAIQKIIKSQFTTLKLNERYKGQCNSEISMLFQEMGAYCQSGYEIKDCIDMISIRADIMYKEYGDNYWKAALYDGFVRKPDVFVSVLTSYVVK